MDRNAIIAGTNTVTFNNTQLVTGRPVEVGFKPSMVVIQTSDPAILFSLETITDTGFTIQAYCVNGVTTALIEFYYQCIR